MSATMMERVRELVAIANDRTRPIEERRQAMIDADFAAQERRTTLFRTGPESWFWYPQGRPFGTLDFLLLDREAP